MSREMTIDDDNSIYVGGLPYDTTEDSLRRVFDLYGAVVAVKIINDREVGGKCYGFVTFTNPRSAIDAINDMNGRTIGGRVVRVNEVKTRGGKPIFNHEHFHRDSERGMDWKRGRGRVRDYDHDTEHYRDRKIDRSRGHDRERERDYDHARDHDQKRDRLFGRDREMYWEGNESERNRSNDRDWEQDWDRGRETNRANDNDINRDKDKDQQSKSHNRSHSVDRHSKELSSNSSDDYHDQVKEQLEMSFQRHEELQKEALEYHFKNAATRDVVFQKHEELQKEISQFEEKLKEKQQFISDLQKKSQTLEDALGNAKKLSSYQQMQLTKLHRCFLQVRDYNERLRSSEQELQCLVDSAMMEADVNDDVGMRDGGALHENGLA